MSRGAAAVAVVIVLWAAAVGADARDPERAFRDASAAGSIDAFEAIGEARPLTDWSDDAWAEAARLAERAGDYPRARHDLEQVIAIDRDALLVRRARSTLARLGAITGAGQWDAVAATHGRLVDQILAGGDPKPALGQLEALIRANPGYPRATPARVSIAQGWERDGNSARALTGLREAVALAAGSDQPLARFALARTLIRADQLDEADAVLVALAATPGAERAAIDDVRHSLGVAETRAMIRHVLAVLVGLLVVVALALLRRDAGSWRAAGRVVAHPPAEVLFLVPIGLVLSVVAATGNPLVARAVRTIMIAGVAIGWLSGALLEATRRRHGALRLRRTIGHALGVLVAMIAVVYLALDHDRMIDLVLETWRSGPAPR